MPVKENIYNDVILDVPFYSEFEEIDGVTSHIEFFKRRSCGIVSLKMVLDYLCRENRCKKVGIDKLIKTALDEGAYVLENGGKKDYGWQHAGLVRTVQKLGFLGFRRKYFIQKRDLEVMKKEGTSPKSLRRYYNQVFIEAVAAFKVQIDDKCPFLISIEKNLGIKRTSHIVVLTGYRELEGNVIGFFVNDPNNPKNGKNRPVNKNQFISLSEFDKIWRKLAIFVEVGE